ncbi:hypothetical protein KY289_001362 [Solanum tuberosum]|nr:hypothetical protein KY289_001362 [Solanum tuberosum]
MNSSNTSELTITSVDKNRQERCKELIQNERSKEYNESINGKEQDDSQEEEPFEKQQHQQRDDINGGLEHTIITSNDSLPDDTDLIRKDNNTDNGSKVFIIDEKDQNYYRLKQGVPRSIKFRSINNIYKHTKRLSSPEAEYNWSRPNNLENQKSKVHNEGKTRKDQVNTFEEIVPNKKKT